MKKLLFVIDSLACAGAEKSLVTLLNLLDYSKYEVDLQLFSFGGEFESLLPKKVRILPKLPFFECCRKTLSENVKEKKWNMLKHRLEYSFVLRTGKYTIEQEAVLFWRSTHKAFDVQVTQYDIAIAYAQGTPTFYVADCVQAKKKYAWINATYKPTGRYRDFVLNKYWEFDKIACVSGSAHEVFKEVFPEVEDKGTVIYDINDGQFMMQMADMGATEDIDMKDGKIKLLTIGRLAEEKGYDIALEACEILKQREIPFVWYALGRGSLEEKIREIIAEKKLGDFFVLLGTRSNPYPYIKYADIYIQTSKTEGYGLAIAEARMLNTPVVTTRFDAVYAQMVDGENGLVVDMTPEAVADGIERLIKDKQLYEHIVNYQKQEKKGNYEEINKFYSLIEE